MNKARKTLKAFLQAWQEKDYDFMFKTCQITWKETLGSKEWIKEFYSKVDIDSFEIVSGTMIEKNVIADFMFRIKVSGKWTIPYRVRLIRELAPYTAHKDGIWGVNPKSALRILSETV